MCVCVLYYSNLFCALLYLNRLVCHSIVFVLTACMHDGDSTPCMHVLTACMHDGDSTPCMHVLTACMHDGDSTPCMFVNSDCLQG